MNSNWLFWISDTYLDTFNQAKPAKECLLEEKIYGQCKILVENANFYCHLSQILMVPIHTAHKRRTLKFHPGVKIQLSNLCFLPIQNGSIVPCKILISQDVTNQNVVEQKQKQI